MEAVPHAGLFYLPGGIIGAMVLGMALAPLRELTNAGNFIFAFVILIIVVGELGGRAAAVATAACSALSLDFFLTKPYLSLRIEEKHDLIAFLGLALCGLVAAALGSRRSGRVEGGPPPR
jgi:K+-sensing histidine kinase KdpD